MPAPEKSSHVRSFCFVRLEDSRIQAVIFMRNTRRQVQVRARPIRLSELRLLCLMLHFLVSAAHQDVCSDRARIDRLVLFCSRLVP